jgi:DNA-binding MarR family transcriptional regulator
MGLVELIAAMREVDPDCSLQKMQVLCFVAACGDVGTDHMTIQQKLDIGKSHTSRIVADWSELTADKKRGPALIESKVDPYNSRMRIVKLTPKGWDVVQKFTEVRL